jgi:hypothetical protein
MATLNEEVFCKNVKFPCIQFQSKLSGWPTLGITRKGSQILESIDGTHRNSLFMFFGHWSLVFFNVDQTLHPKLEFAQKPAHRISQISLYSEPLYYEPYSNQAIWWISKNRPIPSLLMPSAIFTGNNLPPSIHSVLWGLCSRNWRNRRWRRTDSLLPTTRAWTSKSIVSRLLEMFILKTKVCNRN